MQIILTEEEYNTLKEGSKEVKAKLESKYKDKFDSLLQNLAALPMRLDQLSGERIIYFEDFRKVIIKYNEAK